MRIAGNTPTRTSHAAASPAQLALRSALAPYLDDNDPKHLIEALERIQDDVAKDSSLGSKIHHTLIHRLMAVLKDKREDQSASMRAEHINLLGRFDRWLGWQAGQAHPTHRKRLDQMAQSLIHELDTIEWKPRHPLAWWGEAQNPEPSRTIHPDFLAPMAPTLSQTSTHWVCEWAPDTKLALPSVAVKALLDAPALSPIETSPECKVWGFRGLEWADTPLPAIALSTPDHYRSPLPICILILQTPREVAADFAQFGLICPTLPSLVSGKELSASHHQFIDWVAVVREMKTVF